MTHFKDKLEARVKVLVLEVERLAPVRKITILATSYLP
jgi:hypothetical protein